MPEKQVNLELVSLYTLRFDDKPTEVKEHDMVPEHQLKFRDWAVHVAPHDKVFLVFWSCWFLYSINVGLPKACSRIRLCLFR